MTPPNPSTEIARLIDIVFMLRSPGGCPWDREQTIDSLKPFILEEAYELVEAIDRGDHAAITEELGDFLFEAVFVAQLEQESGHPTIADAIRGVADKLVRRHPHVFRRDEGEPALETAGQVRTRWEEIKAQERGGAGRKTLLSGIPVALPALLRAYQMSQRAASVGFDWGAASDVVSKMQEEVDEIRAVVSTERPIDAERIEEDVGDLLFAIANLSRKLRVEPETALRKATEKFARRFSSMESQVAAAGHTLAGQSIEALDRLWEEAKRA